MFAKQLLLASLALVASVSAIPVTTREFASACSADLQDAARLMSDACTLTSSSDPRVAKLGQDACISGTIAIMGTVTSCASSSKRRAAAANASVSLDQAQACGKAWAFDPIDDAINGACFVDGGASRKRADCDTVAAGIFASVSAACPAATVTGDDAEIQLSSAKDDGSQARIFDEAVQGIAALPAA